MGPSSTPHSQMQEWVVFSDLHVCRRSLDTCLRVLDHVHTEAERRGAGVMFLGDFWHMRGSLSVALLNPILDQLSHWRQPSILIPGNHDQVQESEGLQMQPNL